ncbi:MAG: TonB-dependent receptor [Flammeovirgaceae bacterium]|nr:TonB-dependent receptor [Flammeovirgaceae bacterium]
MTKFFLNFVLFSAITLISFNAVSQTHISGVITEKEDNEALIGVNIVVKGSVVGTVTDFNGKFDLKINAAPPIVLVISSIGYMRQEIKITDNNVMDLAVIMEEAVELGQEVVVSASKVEERILESPVSIEKMNILDIQNTSADNYYKAIANLKGVDVASSSINFQIINTRGFANTGNTRFVQLIDGMDTQAPALNFPVGNLNGPSELDVESVELIPGASSALYGPNAFSGVLLINSKNPFEYQGLSAFAKMGINHMNDTQADLTTQPMYEGSIRYAKAFNNKFAFKVNYSYSGAEDWHGTSALDRNAANNPFASIGGVNPGADLAHFQGDEAGINLAIFPFSTKFGALARFPSNIFSNGQYPKNYMDAGDLPNHVVTLTPYRETELIDYGAKNYKINTALHYRLNDKLELSYMFNSGFGTSIYTGAQRYSLANFGIIQHRLQLEGDNFYVRAYTTTENSGDSYITEFLGKRVNDEAVTIATEGNPVAFTDLSGYLVEYGIEYLRGIANQGLLPGEINNLTGTALLEAQSAAHDFARQVVDGKYYAGNGATITGKKGTFTLEDLKSRVMTGVVPDGPLFNDKSAMYQAEGQYDFKNDFNFIDLQVGASFRMFDLGSNGTIFPDTVGNEITIKEYGLYAQAGKRMSDWMKLSGSLRYDKNENFKGQINPRLSAVLNPNKNNFFRFSYQTGFRIPSTQGQYINLDIISSRLLGGLPQYYDYYVPDPENNIYYKQASVLAYRNRVFGGESLGDAASSLERYTEFNPVKPEKIQAFEVGYKGIVNNKLLIDLAYFYNIYDNFITQIGIILPGGELNSNSDNNFSMYTNSTKPVYTQGAVAGLNYSLAKGYALGANYSWNKFIKGEDYDQGNNLMDFNTPEHKINVNFGNRNVFDNFGFNVTYRHQTEFRWESSFAQGLVPAYNTIDAQVSYKLESLQSIVKLGASNLSNKYYIQSLGGPNIGAIYYLSITFDELMR